MMKNCYQMHRRADVRARGGPGVRPWEALLAACAGALTVAGVGGARQALAQGRLQVVPEHRQVIMRAMHPTWVTFTVRNNGGGVIHLMGISGG